MILRWNNRTGLQAFAIGYPVLIHVALYGTWLATGIALGRMPRPMWDQAPGRTHQWMYNATAAWFTIGAALWAISVVALIILAILEREHRRAFAFTFLCSILLMLASYLIMLRDPLEALAWFLD